MKKFIFLCDWGESPKQYKERISKQSPHKDRWGSIQIVDNLKEADYVIINDGLPKNFQIADLRFSNKKIIFMQREAPHVKNPSLPAGLDYEKQYYYKDTYSYAAWRLDKNYLELKNLSLREKRQKPCCILSNKSFTDGQRKRLSFIKKICRDYPGKIDVYGKDLNNFDLGSSYLGDTIFTKLNSNCKFNTLFPYSKALCLENGKSKNFFTRTVEAHLCWTLPIYWGCPNLASLLPEKSFRWIDIEKDTHLALEILHKPVDKEEIDAISEARNLILDKFNFWPYMERILSEVD